MTLARIRSIVGEDAVGCPKLNDSYRMDAFQLESFRTRSESFHKITPASTRLAMRRLRSQDSTEVSLSQGTPCRFFFHNTLYIVEHAYGPWLKSGDWWNSLAWSIEHWDIVASSKQNERLYCSLVHHRDLNRWLISSTYD